MHLSSILVFTSPDNIENLIITLSELPNIKVHYHCHKSGRVIAIQEALDDGAEMKGLRHIKSLPHVIAAEMVYHHIDDSIELSHQEPLTHRQFGGASL